MRDETIINGSIAYLFFILLWAAPYNTLLNTSPPSEHMGTLVSFVALLSVACVIFLWALLTLRR